MSPRQSDVNQIYFIFIHFILFHKGEAQSYGAKIIMITFLLKSIVCGSASIIPIPITNSW